MASKEEKEKKYDFPKDIEGFGYEFNEKGQLRSIDDSEKPYQFEVKEGDRDYNQKRYEALGEVVTDYVYGLMEKEQGLMRISLPRNAKRGEEPRTFFFMSKNAMENADKLLVLIHGSGAVRAGQWARRLIINDCLDSGTQLPFISWALQDGYGVIVANPNLNSAWFHGEERDIRDNSSPEEHISSLWDQFVSKSQAKHIVIVAHSYGGVSTLELARKHYDEFQDRVFAIALTDSVHGFGSKKTPDKVKRFYKERCRNWASSFEELDEPLQNRMDFCPTVSAGTERHEYTSFSSMKSIFKFIEAKLKKRLKEDNLDVRTENSDTDEQIDVGNAENTVDEMSQDDYNRDNENQEKKLPGVDKLLSSSEAKDMINLDENEPMSQDVNSQNTDVEMNSQKDEL